MSLYLHNIKYKLYKWKRCLVIMTLENLFFHIYVSVQKNSVKVVVAFVFGIKQIKYYRELNNIVFCNDCCYKNYNGPGCIIS